MNPKKPNAGQLRNRPSNMHALCFTQHNCVTMDQGIAVGQTYARRYSSNGCLCSTRDRTLSRDLATHTDTFSCCRVGILFLKGVLHSWWAQDENGLSRGWPQVTATRLGNQSGSFQLLSCLSIFGHCSRRELLHSSKQTPLQPVELLADWQDALLL